VARLELISLDRSVGQRQWPDVVSFLKKKVLNLLTVSSFI
jgi:hypothetical protein